MLTDYSGARQGYVSKEADYNQDGVISLDEAARHSTQYLYDQLHYNDYLNGTKALTDYNWTEASESERTQHSRASGFLAWFDQYNDNILSSLTKYGLSLDLGGLPLSKDNLMTLLTTPYDELWDNEAVRNSDAWAAVFASSDNTGTNKTYYEAKAMETTRALYDLWVATSGDVSGVSDSRRNKVEAIVADMMDRDVLPYTDEETASLFQKAFLNR